MLIAEQSIINFKKSISNDSLTLVMIYLTLMPLHNIDNAYEPKKREWHELFVTLFAMQKMFVAMQVNYKQTKLTLNIH